MFFEFFFLLFWLCMAYRQHSATAAENHVIQSVYWVWRTKPWNKVLKWRPGWLCRIFSSLCLLHFSITLTSDTEFSIFSFIYSDSELCHKVSLFWYSRLHFVVYFAVLYKIFCQRWKAWYVRKGLTAWPEYQCDVILSLVGSKSVLSRNINLSV